MGAVTASTTFETSQAQITADEITTPEDLENLRDKLIADSYQTLSAIYEPQAETVEKKVVYGELDESPTYSSLKESGDVCSLHVKSDDGSIIRFSLKDSGVEIHRYGESPQQPDNDLQKINLVATVLLYVMWEVNKFIDQNGLRPVVNEIKQRRWVIMLVCTILTVPVD